MINDDINHLILNKYPYLSEIKPIANNDKDECHEINPLISFSTFLSLETIFNKSLNRKLVLIFPNMLDVALWISCLTVPWIMKKNYESNQDRRIHLTRGQKVLLNGCIVEYDGIVFEKSLNRDTVKVICSNGDVYQFVTDDKAVMQPISGDKPLDSLEKLKSFRKAGNTYANIDKIIGVQTKGNRQYFSDNIVLVSKLKLTNEFLNNRYINLHKAADLFLWGKISTNGDPKLINQMKYQANPSFLVASDFSRLYEYTINYKERVKGVFIDGAEQCVKQHLDILDFLIAHDIPSIVITDMSEMEHIKHFSDRDFNIWHWSNKHVANTTAKSNTLL